MKQYSKSKKKKYTASIHINNVYTSAGVSRDSPHLQFESEQVGRGWRAVDGPVAPGGGQTHRVVAVHVGQEKQTCARTLPHVPEVYGQRGVRDDFPVD